MSTKCCGNPLPDNQYFDLFCSIGKALDQCLATFPGRSPRDFFFRLLIESSIPYPRRNGSIGYKQHRRKRFDGLEDITIFYARCLNSLRAGMTVEDITDDPHEGSACERGIPKPQGDQPTRECRVWAGRVLGLMYNIRDHIESIRSEACHIAQRHLRDTDLNNLPEPEIKISTICANRGNLANPIWRTHIFSPVVTIPNN